MPTQEQILIFSIFIALAATTLGLVWLNIWHRRERAKMTPEEREADDNETCCEMRIW